MPADSSPAEGLYSFFLMGLTWLREDNPDVLSRRGASVFSSFERATPVFKSARMLATMSWDLTRLVSARSVIHEADKPPGKRYLRQMIADSEMHNIILAAQPADLAPEILFGPGGYRHVITDAGIAYAMQAATPYAEIIDRDIFLQGWRKYKAQMTSFNTKHSNTTSQQSNETEGEEVDERGDEARRISPAIRREEDFDW